MLVINNMQINLINLSMEMGQQVVHNFQEQNIIKFLSVDGKTFILKLQFILEIFMKIKFDFFFFAESTATLVFIF